MYHLNRCKIFSYRRGMRHSCPTPLNEAVGMSGKGNVAGFLYLQIYLYYLCTVPPPWVHLRRYYQKNWYIISLLFCTVNVYSDYIYIYISIFLGSSLVLCFCVGVFCTSYAFHNKIRNDSSDQVCVNDRLKTSQEDSHKPVCLQSFAARNGHVHSPHDICGCWVSSIDGACDTQLRQVSHSSCGIIDDTSYSHCGTPC